MNRKARPTFWKREEVWMFYPPDFDEEGAETWYTRPNPRGDTVITIDATGRGPWRTIKLPRLRPARVNRKRNG